MPYLSRFIKTIVALAALCGASGGAHAAITISEPQFLPNDSDTFQVMVSLAEPFGTALDSLDLRLAFDDSKFQVVQVEKQSGLPGTFESVTPKFGTISYVVPATVPTGPLFKLTFDLKAPVDPHQSIVVTVTGGPTFAEEELPPIALSGSVTLIPEPNTYALLGVGLALVGWVRARRVK